MPWLSSVVIIVVVVFALPATRPHSLASLPFPFQSILPAFPFALTQFVAPVALVPSPVVALGYPHQHAGHAVHIHPGEVGVRAAGPVPAVRAVAPVPAVVEENLIFEVLDHLDGGGDGYEAGSRRQAEVEVDADLGLGHGGAEGQRTEQ